MLKNLIFLLIIPTSCLDKIDIETRDFKENQLVVEGNVNNSSGPYFVSLSYASSENVESTNVLVKNPVSGAKVSIVHLASGNSLDLLENTGKLGQYSSPENSTFKGEVGNEYFLKIELLGKTYASTIEKIITPTPIDTVYWDYNDLSQTIEIFIDFTDPTARGDRYIWTWNGYRQFLTNYDNGGSGLNMQGDSIVFDCCRICYQQLTGNEINLFADNLQNGNKIRNQKVTDMYILRLNQLMIEVQLHKTSESAYAFWELLYLQQESQGGLFDPPPFGIKGNMKNIGDDNEEVLGYFFASGVSEYVLRFNAFEYATLQTPFEGTNNDCRLVSKADTLKPGNWD